MDNPRIVVRLPPPTLYTDLPPPSPSSQGNPLALSDDGGVSLFKDFVAGNEHSADSLATISYPFAQNTTILVRLPKHEDIPNRGDSGLLTPDTSSSAPSSARPRQELQEGSAESREALAEETRAERRKRKKQKKKQRQLQRRQGLNIQEETQEAKEDANPVHPPTLSHLGQNAPGSQERSENWQRVLKSPANPVRISSSTTASTRRGPLDIHGADDERPLARAPSIMQEDDESLQLKTIIPNITVTEVDDNETETDEEISTSSPVQSGSPTTPADHLPLLSQQESVSAPPVSSSQDSPAYHDTVEDLCRKIEGLWLEDPPMADDGPSPPPQEDLNPPAPSTAPVRKGKKKKKSKIQQGYQQSLLLNEAAASLPSFLLPAFASQSQQGNLLQAQPNQAQPTADQPDQAQPNQDTNTKDKSGHRRRRVNNFNLALRAARRPDRPAGGPSTGVEEEASNASPSGPAPVCVPGSNSNAATSGVIEVSERDRYFHATQVTHDAQGHVVTRVVQIP